MAIKDPDTSSSFEFFGGKENGKTVNCTRGKRKKVGQNKAGPSRSTSNTSTACQKLRTTNAVADEVLRLLGTLSKGMRILCALIFAVVMTVKVCGDLESLSVNDMTHIASAVRALLGR